MNRLLAGINKFQHEELERYEELFQRLSREGQSPHTLFITCSDSRVLAELVTQSQPGDLFVVKNVGNIIPPIHASGSTDSTAAAVEFAVQTLGVKDIVVCGHSLCGAMAALLDGLPEQAQMPHLQEWLELAAPIKKIIERDYQHLETEERKRVAAEINILFGLENLRAYPLVQSHLAAGTLNLHGWFFDIATAKMLEYNPQSKQFQPIG